MVNSLRCPTCNEWFEQESARAIPFCSERCRVIDLGRWLNEEYSLPHIDFDEDETDTNRDSD
jgi:hypothetical protein